MSKSHQRLLFAVMLLLSVITPLILLLSVLALPESVLARPDWLLDAVLGIVVFVIPLVFLYFAARAAVDGGISGVVVLGSYWLTGVLAAFTNGGPGQLVSALINAATFGWIQPSGNGEWPMPGPILSLGAARTFSFGVPLYVLFLMAAYSTIKARRARIVRTAGHSRLYAAWDESGERVEPPSGPSRASDSQSESDSTDRGGLRMLIHFSVQTLRDRCPDSRFDRLAGVRCDLATRAE